ncbi:hypothetical protein NC651_034988 [Populus alba x Populus x berolinensis]|nr:hypothetical protein NC651_034988 [Populus alba x Populus x berolinensis]
MPWQDSDFTSSTSHCNKRVMVCSAQLCFCGYGGPANLLPVLLCLFAMSTLHTKTDWIHDDAAHVLSINLLIPKTQAKKARARLERAKAPQQAKTKQQ